MQEADDNEARMKQIAEKIGVIFDKIANRKPGENIHDTEYFGEVSDTEADEIREKTGLDVYGFSRYIAGYDILHTLRRHGEKSSDPLPVKKVDLEKIYDIILTRDEVAYTADTRTGQPGIRYEKRINGYMYVVEEYRTGKGKKKRLAFKTMYKTKRKTETE